LCTFQESGELVAVKKFKDGEGEILSNFGCGDDVCFYRKKRRRKGILFKASQAYYFIF